MQHMTNAALFVGFANTYRDCYAKALECLFSWGMEGRSYTSVKNKFTSNFLVTT